MAAAAPKHMECLLDELICSICQVYFTDPVITSCGHNFCRGCIIQYWERYEATTCPECRNVCSEKELIPNVHLGNVTQKAQCLLSVAPGSVVTDSGVCKTDGDTPKLFGEEAQTPICVVCKKSQVHKDPAIIRLEDAAQDRETTRRPETLSWYEEENFLKPSKINSEGQTEAYKQGKEKQSPDFSTATRESAASSIEPTELSTSANKKQFSAGCHLPALRLGNYRIPKERIYQGCIVVLLLAIPACVCIGVVVGRSNSSNSPVTTKEPEAPNCPDTWVGYRDKCYYFSETKGNWTDSKTHCSSLNASLAVIDTAQDLAFLFRHKGFYDHWIGLWRDQEEQLWKWPNGTEFNNLFQVNGKGDCVYLNNNDARSSSCHLQRPCICSTLDGHTKRKQNALHRNSPF